MNSEQQRLHNWMVRNRITPKQMAIDLGYAGRSGVTNQLYREDVSNEFRLRFLDRYGVAVYTAIFEPVLTMEVA